MKGKRDNEIGTEGRRERDERESESF